MKSKRLISAFLSCLLAITIFAQVDETHVRLTNLPHIYINTFTGKDITSKTTYVLAKMWYVDENDSVAMYDSLQIRGRGNSTWNMAKKPYRLKFHQKEKLLGIGYAKTKNWTLLANHGDKSLIRNALTSRLGEWLGLKFNPAAKFVDLTFNDVYVGNYQLSDHVDVRPHRVKITEQDLPLTDESNITGGYLLEVDGFKDFQDGRTGFCSPKYNVPIRIHYPDNDDIVPLQYNYICNFITNFENQLFGDDFTKEQSYRSNVDSTSLANWYLATEISGNVDGFYSTYFYKDQDDDHLYWGPLWDYDIAYANDNRKGDTSQQLMRDVAFGSNFRNWITRMWQDPWFTNMIATRFSKAVNEGVEDYMLEQIDSLVNLLDQSQQLNYQRWAIDQRTLRECVLYSTYSQYISDLQRYVKRHISYLNEVFGNYIPDVPEPKVPDFAADTLLYYAISNSGTSTCFDLTDDDRVCANARNEDSESQQWRIIPLANGYMHIVNRMTGKALNDPTEGEPTATTLTGQQLNTAEADSTDARQQWDLVLQSNNRFNLINHFSHHGANLSGGNHNDGTNIISYTSDDRNATSNNRMWYIDGVAEYTDAIETIDADIDYALAYDPTGDRLHFGCDNLQTFNFIVKLYDQSGRLLRTFKAYEGCNLASLPHGLYIASWSFGGRQHSVKFTK